MLSITLADDGRGIDLERLRRKVVDRGLTTADMAAHMSDAELLEFLFLPGFSTADNVTEISGRGVGLDVVHSMVHSVGGQVHIETAPARARRFQLQLPVTLSVLRAVMVQIAGEPYAFPHNRIDGLIRIARGELRSLEDRQYFEVDGQNVGIVMARQVLQLPTRTRAANDVWSCCSATGAAATAWWSMGSSASRTWWSGRWTPGSARCRTSRRRDPRRRLARADRRSGRPAPLDRKAAPEGRLHRAGRASERASPPRKRVLVVDDSITVREVERQLLADQGTWSRWPWTGWRAGTWSARPVRPGGQRHRHAADERTRIGT